MSTVPVCVALEVLLPGSLLAESVLAQAKANPRSILRLPGRLVRGRRAMWAALPDTAYPDAAHLPYRDDVVALIEAERAGGRRVILAADVPEGVARSVADHLGLDGVAIAAADGGNGLVERFGAGGFDWIGAGAPTDARRAQEPPRPRTQLRQVLRTIRVHQWLKNALVFLPVLAGQRLTDGPVVVRAALAVAAFCMVASSVYVINDLLDLREDRRHATKRNRPFAAGTLPLGWAPYLVAGMLTIAITITAVWLPAAFAATLAAYLVLTFLYSLVVKGSLLIDVFTLAGLYTLRVIAGSAATGIEPSVWLLGFCMFFFLSLALVKRYAELNSVRDEIAPTTRLPGRGYQPADLPVLVALGVGTGCLSVLVLALYVISDEFAAHYSYPWLIWQLCPLTPYWIGRAWMVVSRDEMHDDPLVWAIRDQLSRWVVVAAVLILILAR